VTQSSPSRPCVLNSLHALPVAVLAMPANSVAQASHAKSAKHRANYFSHAFFKNAQHLQ